MGKALSGLIAQAQVSGAPIKHVIACLEKPEKSQFIDRIREGGGEVIVAPDRLDLDELVSMADIVQLEWWNHPATIESLCNLAAKPMRLVVWCHVSGLYNPIIPIKLMEASSRFLFTSPCSFEAKEVVGLAEPTRSRLAVVSSGGGFSDLPEPQGDDLGPISVGYLGSLNFAKLHPDYVKYLSAVDVPGFKVRLIGDMLNRDTLESQSKEAGRTEMFEFRGYTTDVAAELATINVLAYLLNPCHYGTAENALLEAIAMGIVPVVLDNPAERSIVEHLRTGLIVNSPEDFADAIKWLADNPGDRSRIGKQAAASVRARFAPEKMDASFRIHYEEVVREDKRLPLFQDVFGTRPDEWFLSCQRNPKQFGGPDSSFPEIHNPEYFILREKTKGSAIHFSHYFPKDHTLNIWATALGK